MGGGKGVKGGGGGGSRGVPFDSTRSGKHFLRLSGIHEPCMMSKGVNSFVSSSDALKAK